LLYYDERAPAQGTTEVFTTKRFFVLGHFSRYVRPGAVRHEVDAPPGVHVMAFEQQGNWTVVAWNESTSPTRFGIALPVATTSPADAVVTDTTRDLDRSEAPVRTRDGTWLVELPPSTIATYTFTGR
jgi:O-glycosyl hydrolase